MRLDIFIFAENNKWRNKGLHPQLLLPFARPASPKPAASSTFFYHTRCLDTFQIYRGPRDVEALVKFIVQQLQAVPLLPVILSTNGQIDFSRQPAQAAPHIALGFCDGTTSCLSDADYRLVRCIHSDFNLGRTPLYNRRTDLIATLPALSPIFLEFAITAARGPEWGRHRLPSAMRWCARVLLPTRSSEREPSPLLHSPRVRIIFAAGRRPSRFISELYLFLKTHLATFGPRSLFKACWHYRIPVGRTRLACSATAYCGAHSGPERLAAADAH